MQAFVHCAVLALLLTGCAQAPRTLRVDRPLDVIAVPQAQLALSLDAAAPLMAMADEPVFAGEVSLQAIDALLSLKSGYVLRAGDLLTPAEAQRWRANLLPTTLGSQRIGQQVRMQLPIDGAAPLTFVLRDEREQRWFDEADVATRRHGVELGWTPAFAQLQLQWDQATLPWDARSALECPLRGRVSVPLASTAWTGRLGGRACRVAAAGGALPQDARTWSAGVQWLDGEQTAGLRVLTVDAGAAEAAAPAQAVEVGLDHERRLGSWTAHGGFAWRRAADTVIRDQDWLMDASLRRQLGAVAVSAQWQTGDRYWFVPDYGAPTEDLALSLDLSNWLARQWPVDLPTLQLSYRWRAGANDFRDEAVQWRLWMPW